VTKGSLVNFLSEEDRKRLLNFRGASEVLPKQPTVLSEIKKPDLLPPAISCCEFVRGFVFPGSDGRYCVCGTFCPSRIFADPAQYLTCDTRVSRLKVEKQS
jgi:hypothetical protein